jgi:hypothetical protein
MKKRIELIQLLLKKSNKYNGKVDGLMGPNTLKGIHQLKGIGQSWSEKRKIVGAIQALANENSIPANPVDGYWGPISEEAFSQLRKVNFPAENIQPVWRPEEINSANPHNWPTQYTDEFNDFYGNQGDQLISVPLPFTHKFSWQLDKKINAFKCHSKVADSIHSVLTKVLDHYGPEEIKRLRLDVWGGCFNIRPIRGGSKPSMHSWGIAIDYDPNRNKLRWGADKAVFAAEVYRPWWEFWEEEGWVSLGRARNFDWMHLQAARIS